MIVNLALDINIVQTDEIGYRFRPKIRAHPIWLLLNRSGVRYHLIVKGCVGAQLALEVTIHQFIRVQF